MISPWQTVVWLGISWTISGGTKLKIKVKRRFLLFRSFPSFLFFTALYKFISDSQSPIHDSISRSLDSGLKILDWFHSLPARFKDQLTETCLHFFKEREKWLQRQPHVPKVHSAGGIRPVNWTCGTSVFQYVTLKNEWGGLQSTRKASSCLWIALEPRPSRSRPRQPNSHANKPPLSCK